MLNRAQYISTLFLVLCALLFLALEASAIVTAPLVDNCNRSENPLSTGWAGGFLGPGSSGAWLANGSACLAATDTASSAYWSTLLGADHYITATFVDATPSGSQHIRMHVRLQQPSSSVSTADGYRCHFLPGASSVRIERVTDAGGTTISGPATRTIAAGHEIGCQIIGNTVSLHHNNGGGWVQVLSVTDNTYTGAGYTGLWAGGNSLSLDTIGLTTIGGAPSQYHVATTGSDAVSCANARNWESNPTQAKLTIQAGVNCATVAGDTVHVHVGTYTGNIATATAGTSTTPITLRAWPENQVTINGSATVTHDWSILRDLSLSGGGVSVQSGANDIVLLNLTIVNAPTNGINLDGSAGALDNIMIDGCVISDSVNHGIRGGPDNLTIQKTDVTIQNCTISSNGDAGISMSNVTNLTIQDNPVISNNGEEGIAIRQLTTNILVSHNTIENNTLSGILINAVAPTSNPPISGGAPFTITRNKVVNNGSTTDDACIRTWSTTNAATRSLISNNICAGSGVAGTDGISLFRTIEADLYHNTIYNAARYGIRGQCYRDGDLKNNIVVGDGPTFFAETSANDCTGYANGLISEDYNLLRTTGTTLIQWTTGESYSNLVSYQMDTAQGIHSKGDNPQFTLLP